MGTFLPVFFTASKMPDQSGLGLQDVLAGLEQQNVDAALDQPERLLRVASGHLVQSDMAKRRQLRVGPIEPATKRLRPLVE